LKDRIQKIRNVLEQNKGRASEKQSQMDAAIFRRNEAEKQSLLSEQAQFIIQVVAKLTQDQLRYRIEEPVTLAMQAVFDQPLALRMEFPIRRGRTECDMIWVDANGNEYDDLEYSDGGGALDVAAFSLQIAVLALMKNHARSVLVLDEPLKWLKGGDLPERGAMMINEISRGLGIQVIMVSHIPEQKAGADRIINVSLDRKGVSQIS